MKHLLKIFFNSVSILVLIISCTNKDNESTISLQSSNAGSDLEHIGRARVSAVYDIEVVPPYAYALERGILRVLDINDPQAVHVIGSLEFDKPRDRMLLRHPYLYLGGLGQPIGVIEISEPKKPNWITELRGVTGTMNDGIEMAGAHIYVVRVSDTNWDLMSNSGLPLIFDILDLKNPALPNLIASIDLDVRVKGMGRAHIAHSNERAYIYVSSKPQCRIYIINTHIPSEPQMERILYLPEGQIFGDLEIRDDMVFILQSSPKQGLSIFRILENKEPRLLGELTNEKLWNPKHLIIQGDVVHTTFKGEIAFASFDVTNPSDPKLIYTYEIGDRWAAGLGMTLLENRIYVAGDGGPSPIFDVSVPKNPHLLGRWEFEGGWVRDVLLEDKLAILPQYGGGIIIYDVRNPAYPKRFVRIQISLSEKFQRIVETAVNKSRLFIAYETLPAEFYDITDPSHPVVLGRFNPKGQVLAVALSPMNVFLGYRRIKKRDGPQLSLSNHGGIEVVDLSNPHDLRSVANLELDKPVTDIRIRSPHLIAVHHDGSLRILDIKNPEKASILCHYEDHVIDINRSLYNLRSRLALSRDGNIAYVLQRETINRNNFWKGNDILHIIDLKNITAPHVIGRLIFDRHDLIESSIAVKGKHVVIFSGDILIVDANNPNHPFVKLKMPFPPVEFWAPGRVGLALDDEYLYLGIHEDGLWIYRLPSFLE